MTEANRVFSGMKGRAGQVPSSEQRIIQRRIRQGGISRSQMQVVEVVHVRHGTKRAVDDQAQLPRPDVSEETWRDEADAALMRQLPDLVSAPAAEPQQSVAHVMPMWEPRVAEMPLTVPAGDALAEAPAPAKRKRGRRPGSGSKATDQRYADPFAEEDIGANCLRCGYLVEPARERRGWLTCAKCS